VKLIVKTRERFKKGQIHNKNVGIFIDESLSGWWGTRDWLSQKGLEHCPRRCTVTRDAGTADVMVHNIRLPDGASSDKVNVIINFEAHSYVHNTDSSTILVSYHQESDVVATYGFSVMQAFGLCIGNVEGVTQHGKDCENMRKMSSPFWDWCSQTL
jgi:hypothetical protein